MALVLLTRHRKCAMYASVLVPSTAVPSVTCSPQRCCVGWGAVKKTAKVKEGSTVAVFGLGVIGLAVIEVRYLFQPGFCMLLAFYCCAVASTTDSASHSGSEAHCFCNHFVIGWRLALRPTIYQCGPHEKTIVGRRRSRLAHRTFTALTSTRQSSSLQRSGASMSA